MDRAVDPHLGDALPGGGGDGVEVEALAAPDEGCEHRKLAAGEVLGHTRGETARVHDLPREAAPRAVDLAQARPEEAQVVEDLGGCPYRRERRPA